MNTSSDSRPQCRVSVVYHEIFRDYLERASDSQCQSFGVQAEWGVKHEYGFEWSTFRGTASALMKLTDWIATVPVSPVPKVRWSDEIDVTWRDTSRTMDTSNEAIEVSHVTFSTPPSSSKESPVRPPSALPPRPQLAKQGSSPNFPQSAPTNTADSSSSSDDEDSDDPDGPAALAARGKKMLGEEMCARYGDERWNQWKLEHNERVDARRVMDDAQFKVWRKGRPEIPEYRSMERMWKLGKRGISRMIMASVPRARYEAWCAKHGKEPEKEAPVPSTLSPPSKRAEQSPATAPTVVVSPLASPVVRRQIESAPGTPDTVVMTAADLGDSSAPPSPVVPVKVEAPARESAAFKPVAAASAGGSPAPAAIANPSPTTARASPTSKPAAAKPAAKPAAKANAKKPAAKAAAAKPSDTKKKSKTGCCGGKGEA